MKLDWPAAVFSVALVCESAYLLTRELRPEIEAGVRLLLLCANVLWFGMTAARYWYGRKA